MKYFFLAILGVVVIGAGSLVLKVVLFPVNTIQKEIDIAYDAQDKVLTAENAIYNYEWFKQKFQDIRAADEQYSAAIRSHNSFRDSLPADRLKWSFEDKTEDSRLRAVTDGLYNFKTSLVADYNARASMATRNIFEDSVLPNYIDALTFIRK